MTIAQSIVLGIVQGITEFVPISSSAHLVIVPYILHWPQPSISFDVLLHLGTLISAVVYFRADIKAIMIHALAKNTSGGSSNISINILLSATAVTLVVALVLEDFAEKAFMHPKWVAGFLIITAIILILSERMSRKEKGFDQLNLTDAILVGLVQGLAVFPGISRSGITISTAMARRLGRSDAARLSFLLAIPVILLAAVSEMPQLLKEGISGGPEMLFGFLSAAASGYVAIKLLISFLSKRPLYVFAVYCAAVGVIGVAVF